MNYPIAFALFAALNLGVSFLNLPPVLDALMVLYGVSYGGLSVLLSALLWSHVAMQLPAGVIADRLGLRPTLLVGLTAMSLGNLLPALSPDLELAIAGRVVTGIGTGLVFVTAMKLMALHAPEDRGGAYQGYYGGFFSIGTILAYLSLPTLVHYDWRWPYLTAALGSLAALAMVPFLRLRPAPPPPRQRLFQPLRLILAEPVVWVIGGYHALSWGMMLNLGHWVPSVLAEVWDSGTALHLAWGGALVMLISGLGRLSGGIVMLRVRPVALANGSIGILAAASLCLALAWAPWMVLVLMVIVAWCSSTNFGALFYLAGRGSPKVAMATVFGFVNLLANLGAIIFTLSFGWVKEMSGSFSGGFGMLAILAISGWLFGRRVLRQGVRFY
jgi:MFS family permease